MAVGAGDSGAVWAVSEVTLTTSAINIVEVDLTNTSSKMSRHCTYWIKLRLCLINIFIWTKTMQQTLCGIAQFSTHYNSISSSPGVITHSTPLIVHADLHSAFTCYIASCQSQLTSCARSCMNDTIMCVINFKYLCAAIPSHPTPASAEWRQLCDRIGLL